PIFGLINILTLRATAIAQATPELALSSSAFQHGSAISAHYTCTGANISPPLNWKGVPGGTNSFALIVDDPDAPMGPFVHWVVYNLPGSTAALPENVPASASAEGGEQGVNGRNEIGYTGPCPPPGESHHYHFRLYALRQRLKLDSGATAQQVQAAMAGHILA